MITYTEAQIDNSPYTNYVQLPSNELHNHTFWELFVALSGNCNHFVNGKKTSLSLGNVYIMRPLKDSHYFNIVKDLEFYRQRDIYLTDSDMKTYCDIISPTLYNELLSSPTAISFNVSSSMCKYIEELFAPLNSDSPKNSQILKNIHLAVAINILTSYQTARLPKAQPEWLEKFIQDLKNPDNFVVSIEELIAKIPYSHGYICKEFKKHMNQTIVNFFNIQKINHASFLLMNSNLKILDISILVGYSSPKNFIKQFTKIFQLSPSAWRTKNQLQARK